jgi:hypothetical protein
VRGPGWWLGQERGGDGREHRVLHVRRFTGQDLMQDGAQEVHVRARVDGLAIAGRELRRHVRGRAHDPLDIAGPGQEIGEIVVHAYRDAPVEQIQLAVVADHDVARLEVQVHDAAGMREMHRVTHLHEGSQVCLHRVAILESEGPLAAFHPAHDQERRLALTVERVHRNHVGMLESPADPRLAEQRLGGRCAAVWRLDGHLAPERALGSTVHHTHGPAPELVAQHRQRTVPRSRLGQFAHQRRPGERLGQGVSKDRTLVIHLDLGRIDPAPVPDGLQLAQGDVCVGHLSR